MKPHKQIELPGELIYRPPTGKPEDRMLALATGRTENGDKLDKKETKKSLNGNGTIKLYAQPSAF